MSSVDSSFSPPTDEEVFLYHQVWRALQTGSATRRALPPELLLHIVAFCGWVLPYRIRTQAKSVSCYSYGGNKAERLWFTSAPLAGEDIGRIAAIQLITIGKDQGWVDSPNAGSWSWFEVGIERPFNGPVAEARWKSHHNELGRREPTMRAGPLYPAPHEWQVGDIVNVWACAQYPAWSNTGEQGILKFYKWFEPFLPLPTILMTVSISPYFLAAMQT